MTLASPVVSPGPAEEAGQLLSFEVIEISEPTLFSTAPALAADGTLTFTSADHATGIATINIRSTDDGGIANGGVDVSVEQSFEIRIADIVPPQVLAFSSADGAIEDCDELRQATSILRVSFSEEMADPDGDMFSGPGCSGDGVGLAGMQERLRDIEPQWLSIGHSEAVATTVTPQSAMCGVILILREGSLIDAHLDRLSLEATGLFTDGFESGDLSAWSSVYP